MLIVGFFLKNVPKLQQISFFSMPVVTIISDWSNDDYYAASLKGGLYRNIPGVTIVDISHKIQRFNLNQASYILSSAFRKFPEGTIHLICVDSEAAPGIPHIFFRLENHFFISADNGIVGLLSDLLPDEVFMLPDSFLDTFPEVSVFVETCKLLCSSKPLSEIGKAYPQYRVNSKLIPTFDNDAISGIVMYIDSYSNLHTNISKELFYKVAADRSFDIFINSNKFKVSTISSAYNQVEEGELVAIFNAAGFLEIAQNKGNVADILKVSLNGMIRVKFYKNKNELRDDAFLKHFKGLS